MGDWPSCCDSCIVTGYPTTAGNYSVNLTAHANANTKGAWVELIAATLYAGRFGFHTITYSGTGDYLIDVGIGAAGQEVVVINNLPVGLGSSLVPINEYITPLNVPAGSRVSLRVQCSTGGRIAAIQGYLIGDGGFNNNRGFDVCDTYGANTADSGGVSVDPGGAVDTKGAWSEIISATVRAARGLCVGIGNQVNTGRTNAYWVVDVGVGAAGSEVEIIKNFPLFAWTASDAIQPNFSSFFPIQIPLGVRLSMRTACTINDATDRLFDGFLYCFS